MARAAKPFQYRGNWVSKIGGRITKLAPVGPNDGKNPPNHVLVTLGQKRDEQAAAGTQSPLRAVVAKFLAESLTPHGNLPKSPKTVRKNRDQLKTLCDLFGDTPLDKFGIAQAREWGRKMDYLEGSGWNSYVKTCRALFAWAMKEKLCNGNPFKDHSIPLKDETNRKRIITQGFKGCELSRMLGAASPEFRQRIIFMLACGTRPQDLLQAQWAWWDGDRSIVIPKEFHKTGRKTSKPKVVYLETAAVKLLKLRQRTAKDKYIFGGDNLHREFKKLREQAGIGPDENGEELVPYSLRHTVGTKAGLTMPQSVIKEIMGWRSMAMADRYMHPANKVVLSYLK